MPFVSRQQEKWAFATHQKFAKKWAAMTNQESLPKRKKKRKKYQLGGNDEQRALTDANFFDTLYNAAQQRQQQDQQDYADIQTPDNQSSNVSNTDLSDLEDQISELKDLISSQKQSSISFDPLVNDSYKNDDFLNLLFSDDGNNDPIVFGDLPSVDNPINNDSTTFNYNTSIPHGFSGIFKNEGAATGQLSNSGKSSALGRGQMVKGTRMLMYKELGINDVNAAEQKFKTDPNFEQTVLNKYREDLDKSIPNNITGKQRDYMIAKGWYTGNVNYPDNKVPHPEAGNSLTAGQYAKNAVKQAGGTANTPEELYRGLNETPFDSMILNLPDTYNTIRGLDSGQPIYVKDQHGNSAILKGNKHTKRLRGKVYELKL